MSLRLRVAIVLGALAMAWAGVLRADRPEPALPRTAFALFPMTIEDWQGVAQPRFSEDVERVLGADDYLTRAYVRPDRASIGLFIGYWASQRTGDTMHSPLNCLPGAGWEPVSQSRLAMPAADGLPGGDVNRIVIQKGLDRQLVLYWYQSHGRLVASEYWGKIQLVTDAVRLNRTDGAIVRVIVPIGNDPDAEARAEAVGLAFVRTLLPRLGPFIPA
ncbi:MAG: EpsI family protein [Vicinamibacterales bacterium]